MHIPPNLVIHQTTHWLINHRIDSHLPGYLMLVAKQTTNSMANLPAQALAELGLLQAQIQQAIETHLHPTRLYIGRFGHDAGYAIHFHFIPIYPWVEALFWADERYRSLQTFGSLPDCSNQTDGAELTLFVWREFCERPDPPPIEGPSIDQAIAALRQVFGADTSI